MIRLNEGARHCPPCRALCAAAAGAALALALSGPAQAVIPASERQVLLDLYSQTNGAAWDSWCSERWNGATGSECQWRGVVCDAAENHVERIHLWSCDMAGELPPLAGLSALRDFDVSWNNLTGSIPPLSGLTALEHFAVPGNMLSGAIPPLSGLTALIDFDARYNRLTGSIPHLSGLTTLEDFSVDYNYLTGSIPDLTGLAALRSFSVSGNQLIGPIPPLSGLTALVSFGAVQNELTGSIPALTYLPSLRHFHVEGNLLTGSIPALTGLTALVGFNAQRNQLTGSIPPLTDLPALRWFIVGENQLTGPVPDVPIPNELANGYAVLCPNPLDRGELPPTAIDLAWNAATRSDPWWGYCIPPDPTSVMIVPVVANTISYETEVHVRNDRTQAITLYVNFYEADNSSAPGRRPCDPFTVPATATRQLTLGTQCALGAGSHFGMLMLEDLHNPGPFNVYSRSQTPAGVGFSVEGVPFGAFSGAPSYVEGLRRTNSGANYVSNCFVGALGQSVDYRVEVLTADGSTLGHAIIASTPSPFHMVRYFDVLNLAGAPAGDYGNVRVRFSETGGGSPSIVGFCTMQESVTFGADFRIAKPADRAVPAVLVPIVAQTGSYSTEVHVRNHHPQDLTLAVNFHEADNSSVPGPRPCTPFTVPANTTAPLALGSQCTLGAGSHFGMLVLENTASPLGFTVFSRSQTPQGVGFSVEGFPLAGFGAQPVAAEGLKRTATGPKYLANCFVGALGAPLDYRLDLMTSDDVAIGGPLTGSLQANRIVRHLDVLAAAGAPAGDYAGVRARFSRTAGSGALLGFCTMQESLTFSADFRIGK